MTPKVHFRDLGLIDFKEAWDHQTKLFTTTVETKIKNKKIESELRGQDTYNHLIFCEHPHVYTLGKSGSEKNLLISEAILQTKKAKYYKINRGGDITYHGPGQLVGYPIFDLESYFFTDIHKYMRYLEEAVILTLAEYGIQGERIEGMTGVWLDGKTNKARKICAFGVKSSRWVTMHGFALNINTDLSYFEHIIPCGIANKSVTSIAKELNKEIPIEEVALAIKINLANIFGYDYI